MPRANLLLLPGSWVSQSHSFTKLAKGTTWSYHSQTPSQNLYFIPNVDFLRKVQYSLKATIKMDLRSTVLPERMMVQTSYVQKALRA